MTLSLRLGSIEALYRKLERESVRAFHHANLTHKSDHFYNFCITAHSMRDHLLERLGKVNAQDRQPFFDAWQLQPSIVAVADIANTAKHFQLRTKSGQLKTAKTKKVGPGATTVFDIFLASDGKPIVRKRTGVKTIVVTLEDGRRLEMYPFMAAVMSYWKDVLSFHGIRVHRQSWASLHGRAT